MTEIRETLRLTDLNLEELNRVMGRLQDRLDAMEGRRGTPRFYSDLNLGNNRITGVGAAVNPGDAVAYSQLTGSQATTLAELNKQVAVLSDEIDTLTAQLEKQQIAIGGIYISTVATNPATSLGYGTWAAFGAGRVLVGLDSGDTDFDTAEETGGAKTVNLQHLHTIGHTHGAGTTVDNNGDASTVQVNDAAHVGDSGNAGSTTQSIVQPYIVTYFWKRTA